MQLYVRTELSQLACEIEQLCVPDQRGANDKVKFSTTKEKSLKLIKRLYGETSREFRVVEITHSPATVVKVINHIIQRTNLNSPHASVVNM